jgi:predicted nicotinamide N-methyase
MLIVSPDSEIAMKMFAEEARAAANVSDEEDEEDEWDEDDEEDFGDEGMTVEKLDEMIANMEDDEDDEDWMDEDEDDMSMGEEDWEEDEDEENDYSDNDLYEEVAHTHTAACAHDHHNHGADADTAGVYHAFIADSLARCRPSAALVAALPSQSDAARHGAQARPSANRSSGGIVVQGMQYRRAKALPPGLQKKREEQAASAPRIAPVSEGINVGFRPEGQASALLDAPSGVSLLDPLNGVFTVNTNAVSSTLSTRQAMQQASYAYIKVVQGTSIGARIWDGALYMMRFITRLTQQSQNWLDGLRVMELGAGTGVLGIWLYQVMYQRAQAQMGVALDSLSAPARLEAEAAIHALCGGNFKFASVELNGEQDYVNPAFTTDANAVKIARALQSYAKPPLMVVTDQAAVYDLLRNNVSMNEAARLPHWKQTAKEDAISVTVLEGDRAVIQCDNPEDTRKPAACTPASGLHVCELDWADKLSKSLLKISGVVLTPGQKKMFVNPQTESLAADERFASLRSHIASIYDNYSSLKKADGSFLDTMLSRHYLSDRRRRPAFQLNTMPGLDVVLASECLYNDRYFSILVDTINRLYEAHEFAHAQAMDAYNAAVAEYKTWCSENDVLLDDTHIPAAPTKTLPLVLFSYRLRATHEEQAINDTFFKPLEASGKFHTAIPLSRVLAKKEEVLVSRPVHDVVYERAVQRKEREDEIRNAMADLDKDRQEQTRLAVLYQCPGSTPSSPLATLSPNAAFLFKLFQSL